MADTGLKAGQQLEFAVRLELNGAAVTYANKTAFEAAGWSLKYRAAQVEQTPTYTVQPWTAMGDGWNLIVVTAVDGHGPVGIKPPATGEWMGFAPIIAVENSDLDDVKAILNTMVSVPSSVSRTTFTTFEVIEGDTFSEEITVLEAAITAHGYTPENLTDGTLSLSGAVRLPGNRIGIPNAWLAVTVVTAVTGSNPVLKIGWGEYPLAQAGIIEGMELPATDTDAGPTAFKSDVQFTGTRSFSITAVDQGQQQFTIAGDQSQYFAVGGQWTATGTNAGTYTTTAVQVTGGNTIITVNEAIPSAVVDGATTVNIVVTLGRVTLNVNRQEDRS